MPIQILCPLSKQAIKNPVIYKGYIYDKSSLTALVALRKAPADLTEESIKGLPIDHFTNGLLEFSRANPNPDRHLIPISAYDSTQVAATARSTVETILDEIYKDTNFCFPGNGVLCVADGRLDEESFIESRHIEAANGGTPFLSPINRAPLDLQKDFLTHPIYQHLMNELKKAKEEEKVNISLNTIFENFEQPEAKRISFGSRLHSGYSILSRLFDNPSILWLVTIACTFLTAGLLIGFSFKFSLILIFPPMAAIIALAVMIPTLLVKDTALDFKDIVIALLKKIDSGRLFLMIVTLSPILMSLTPIPFMLLAIKSTLINPIILPAIAIILAAQTVKLLIKNSFFDKEAVFNLEKSPEQIKSRAAISLAICLVLTAAIAFGIFVTLSSFSLPIAAVVMYLLPAIPAIFNSLYRNVYSIRCSNFFNQLFSGNINLNLFKNLSKISIAYTAIFIGLSIALSLGVFPVIGLLGASMIGVSTFLISINLCEFHLNNAELQARKLMATSPLVRLELENSDRGAFQREISKLATPTPSSSTSAASEATSNPRSSSPTATAALTASRQLGIFAGTSGRDTGVTNDNKTTTPLLEDSRETLIRGYGTHS